MTRHTQLARILQVKLRERAETTRLRNRTVNQQSVGSAMFRQLGEVAIWHEVLTS